MKKETQTILDVLVEEVISLKKRIEELEKKQPKRSFLINHKKNNIVDNSNDNIIDR